MVATDRRAERQQTLIIVLHVVPLYPVLNQFQVHDRGWGGLLTQQLFQPHQTKLLVSVVDYFSNATAKIQEHVTR
jgi:hypothetical protein